jgi:hypothetical protein
VASFTTQLVEVVVPVANDELVQVDDTTVTELYGKVGVLGVVPKADHPVIPVSRVIKPVIAREYSPSVRHKFKSCGGHLVGVV